MLEKYQTIKDDMEKTGAILKECASVIDFPLRIAAWTVIK